MNSSRVAVFLVVWLVLRIGGVAPGLSRGQGLAGALTLSGPISVDRSLRDRGGGGPAAYPRHSKDGDGRAVTIERRAKTVASLQWKVDEFVYSLVAPADVVA